jgi:hypothetical protein
VLNEGLGLPVCEQEFDYTSGFQTKAHELLLRQQPLRIDGGQLGERGGPPKIIEGLGYLLVPTLEDSEDGQVALMMTLGAIRANAIKFSKDALAKPIECNWNHLSQQLPIGFFDLAQHSDS